MRTIWSSSPANERYPSTGTGSRERGSTFRHLPEEQRAVLILVCMDGLSFREMAATLHIPMGTVMSRLARGVLALARRIEAAASSSRAENSIT
jgi:DNA-directed RNA polymerase specialized sigma24 family protein